MSTRTAFPDDWGFDRRRLKAALRVGAALITLGVIVKVLPKKAEGIAAVAGLVSIIL